MGFETQEVEKRQQSSPLPYFHFGEISIAQGKMYLKERGVPVKN